MARIPPAYLKGMPRRLHNVPANEIRSEWVHVRSGSLSWELLHLAYCEDGTLYFFQAWDPEPVLSVALNEVKEIFDCETKNPEKKRTQVKIEAYLATNDLPCRSKLSKAFKASNRKTN